MIAFNVPAVTGHELAYVQKAIGKHKLSGNGEYTKACHRFFEERYGFTKCLLTTSCTDALEMCALLLDLQPDDEVIMPSYTFVSTANAFVLRGAKLVFADSHENHPNLQAEAIAPLITPRTKAIVVVHYAGMACAMDQIMALAEQHGLYVVEDAAQAIEASYQGRQLGTWGHLSAFSFHETKNINCGEGGLLGINDPRFVARAEILWEKGTNRSAFFRGETDKYGWVDLGSSFLPSELNAAFLWAQLEQLDTIQNKRHAVWQYYWQALSPLAAQGYCQLPLVPPHATHNAHIFYLVLPDLDTRTALIRHLAQQGVHATFHYLSLHTSQFYRDQHDGRPLPHCDHFSDCLVRLPLHFHLSEADQAQVVAAVQSFFLSA